MHRIFRALMRLFPSDFRGDFGDEMEEVFADELSESDSASRQARLWAHTTGGILRTGLRLHLEQAWQDTKYAARNLRRAPAFTAVATAALAFGIGGAVSTFGLADAFLFRDLPFAQPDRLVHVWAAEPTRGYTEMRASRPELEAWASRADLFDGVALFNYTSVELTSGSRPERVPSGAMGPTAFDVLGVAPLTGRTFRPEDAEPGAPRVTVLTERFWRARLNARADVIGSTIDIAGAPWTVVGVMPASFVFPLPTTELWTPRMRDPATQDADYRVFQVVARLRPDVTMDGAERALNAAAPDLARAHPSLEGRTVNLVPLRSALNFADDIFSIGFVVVGLANLLVLLTACANISSLMLGRAVQRGREVAIRTALGASRFRMIRQFMVESLVLAVAGGAGGVLAALWSLRLAGALMPAELYRVGDLGVDFRAVVVALALACGSALAFGLVPALRFARVNLAAAMRQEHGGAGSRSGLRLQSLMVQGQIGLSVVLLVGTVLVGRSFRSLTAVDPGFNPHGVLSLGLVLPGERYAGREAVARFQADVTTRASAVPGIIAATTVNYLPLNHEVAATRISVPGRELVDNRAALEATELWIGPDYFRVMGIPLRQGRSIEVTDTLGQPRIAVVNASLAGRYFPDGSAIGATLQLGDAAAPVTIVGIVGNSRQVELSEAERDQVFLAMAQQPQSYFRLLARTTAGDPRALAGRLRDVVHDVDPFLPVVQVLTLDEVVDAALLPERSLSLALVGMGAFTLALALLGLYGIVMVYVVDRARELGIRMALGADQGRIVREVLVRGLRLAAGGSAVGLVLSIAGSFAARGLLYGVAAVDPLTYAVVVTLVVAVAVVAGVLPARRAARISPWLSTRAL